MKGNSFGGTLSVAELIEERAPPKESTFCSASGSNKILQTNL